MTIGSYLQLGLYLASLLLLSKPLGSYIARVYEGQNTWLDRVLGPVERLTYRLCGIRTEETGWQTYALAMLLFNLLSFGAVYLFLRLNALLPLNPQGLAAVEPHTALNIAISFATNTNWQNYGGETTLGYLPQMVALAVQNFVSAAAGMAVLAALARGFARRSANTVGSFWVDLTRTTLYVLLPLCIVVSLVLVSQGVIQNFSAYQTAATLDGAQQTIAMGPAAAQIAIKQLGTNGGGFFNVNSAHPFENPSPLSNFVECLSILLIPAALCYTFGKMVGDTRQGWALLAAMTVILVIFVAVTAGAEQNGNPLLSALGVDQTATAIQPGGNMEGKEQRFGVANSALWAVATTAASNGSVNSMHDSFTPVGGLMPLFMIQLGEVIFGGVGSGLYGMLIFAIIAVFVAGLMVGRTPEYLGKKVESFEIKMAMIGVLVPPMVTLAGTAAAVLAPGGLSGIANPGAHGFSEVLYAFTSQGNNNGSAFAGYGANMPFVNVTGGLAMLFARYWVALPALAIAGSLGAKRRIPYSLGTLPTHTPLFVGLLIGTVVIIGGLTFFPSLALGPIVEQLQLNAGKIVEAAS